MKIGLDIMGGDFAPAEAMKGVQLFFQQSDDASVHLLLIGDPTAATPYLPLLEPYKSRYTFIEAQQVIGMDEHPTKALKEKPQSSIAIGFGLMQQKKSDAFISAGNTGAMMVGAMFTVKTTEGILRPPIASPIPCTNGKFHLMVDAGANADCKPEHLLQFAHIGKIYMQHVMDIANPRIGLLNIGEEEGKGNILSLATHALLKEDTGLNFIGNIEGRDVFLDKCDVIVCEGFVGNVILKMAESIYQIFNDERKISDEFLNNFNYEVYGGCPILGINEPVVIGHGISHAVAFKNMIIMSSKIVSSKLMDSFRQHFSQTVV